MYPETKMYLFLAAFVVISLAGILLIANLASENKPKIDETLNRQACMNLGCSNSTNFIGSVDSKKYYNCLCDIAKNITPENLVCFSSEYKAKILGYKKGVC